MKRLQPRLRNIRQRSIELRHSFSRVEHGVMRQLVLPVSRLMQIAAAGDRHEVNGAVQHLLDGQAYGVLVHAHHANRHGVRGFGDGFDFFLAHQVEFLAVALAGRGAGHGHACGAVADYLRRCTHHFPGLQHQVGPCVDGSGWAA